MREERRPACSQLGLSHIRQSDGWLDFDKCSVGCVPLIVGILPLVSQNDLKNWYVTSQRTENAVGKNESDIFVPQASLSLCGTRKTTRKMPARPSRLGSARPNGPKTSCSYFLGWTHWKFLVPLLVYFGSAWYCTAHSRKVSAGWPFVLSNRRGLEKCEAEPRLQLASQKTLNSAKFIWKSLAQDCLGKVCEGRCICTLSIFYFTIRDSSDSSRKRISVAALNRFQFA